MSAQPNARNLNPFKPPFRGLTAILFIYFIACFFLHPNSAIRMGMISDPDAAMYLTETLNLIDGQGWYDRVEHRLDPPQGVLMHFSRLAELPYAAVIVPLQALLGRIPAALLSALIWPPIFLLGLMLVLRWQAQCFMPRSWASLTALTTILAIDITFVFMPGRAGHRGVIPLLIALAMACLSRLILIRPASWRWAVMAGAALALGLSFSIEALPWILLLAGGLGLWATVKGGELPSRAGLIFGSSLAAAGTFLLAIYRPAAEWLSFDFISLSAVYIVLLLAIAICFATVWIVRRQDIRWRFAAAIGMAVLTGGGFFLAFPQFATGPYGDVDPRFAHLMMTSITETVPLYKRMSLVPLVFGVLPWPLVSLAVCLWHIKYDIARRRWLWGGFALMQAAGLLLPVFYESRCADYMQMFGIVPLTVLLYRGLHAIGKTNTPRHIAQRAAMIALLPVLSPGLSILTSDPSLINLALFPMQYYIEPCRNIRAAALLLSSPPFYEGEPKLIINPMNEGPELLLFTPHNVLAAPYPQNVTGNLDVLDFFHATDPQTARRIAADRGADFVVSCRFVESAYLIPDGAMTDIYKLGYFDVPDPPPLAFRLMRENPPDWMAAIAPGQLGNTLVYQIGRGRSLLQLHP